MAVARPGRPRRRLRPPGARRERAWLRAGAPRSSAPPGSCSRPDRLGIRAPSLYKHIPDKPELEVALVGEGLEYFGEAFGAAGPGLGALAGVYRSWALAHPHLYRLMNDRPLPRGRLPEGREARAAEPLLAAAHGLASLELAGRFPDGADVDAAWAAMVRAFDPPG